MPWFEHGTSRIYYEESGSGEPVLLLPGFADQVEAHSALRSALTGAGYRVIAADLPGSGRSEPLPRKYPASFYEDDARSFVALLKHLGATPAHLIGWSTGGEIALLMAAQTPDIALSVVTWGAFGKLSDPNGQVRMVMNNIVDDPIPPLQEYSKYMIATYGADNARAMVHGQSAAVAEIIEQRGGDISLSKAWNINCPVFLIAGEHDFFAPPAFVSELATHIPDAKTLMVEGVGHDVHNARPEWFVQTVVNWLTTERSKGPAVAASTQA